MKRLFIWAPGRETQVPHEWTLGAGETLSCCFVILPGVSVELPLTVDITGEDASLELAGCWICGGDERVSLTVRVNHRCGHSQSRQLFNGIAGGTAVTDFDGRIVIEPDAQQVAAYQENHNILYSDTATVRTRPQLEIYADDVQCSHGATTGRLDADEQFYMRSRGIPENEAKVLQMISFLSPVLSYVEEERRDEVAALLEAAVRALSFRA